MKINDVIEVLELEGCRHVHYDWFVFSGGEVHAKINSLGIGDKFEITWRNPTSNGLMLVGLLTDALRRESSMNFDAKISLVMPYTPYARQDRVCATGEAHSMKVFADMINSLNFVSVEIVDPHSDVAPALINNCNPLAFIDIVSRSRVLTNLALSTIAISPDAGSNKKIQKLSEYSGKSFIRADKERSVIDGSITGTVVYCDDLKGQDVTIWDDICDGGRTFIELAKKLREKNAGKINLYVTHGIFSKGIEVLLDSGIDKIYTTDSIIQDINNEKLVTVKL